MSQSSRRSPRTVLRDYFRAKDENRPRVLNEVFAADAELKVVNNSTNIEFPAICLGRDAIAETLVRRFAQTYENVYSFYLSSPPDEASEFSTPWMVGMTEKDSKNVRVGCGRYDWTWQTASPHLACDLVITIEAMQVLPPVHSETVFAWLERLSYPWTSPAEVTRQAPSLEQLVPVLRYLGRAS